MADNQVTKLTDGTELIPLEAEEKEKLEAELSEVFTKYSARYLPVIQEEKTLSQTVQKATIFLLKVKQSEVLSPIQPNGEPTTEETPKAD